MRQPSPGLRQTVGALGGLCKSVSVILDVEQNTGNLLRSIFRKLAVLSAPHIQALDVQLLPPDTLALCQATSAETDS